MQFPCPHCHTMSPVRHSKVTSPLVTRMFLQCKNINCGHTWGVDAEAAATIDPSACPNGAIQLEMSPMAERERQKLVDPNQGKLELT